MFVNLVCWTLVGLIVGSIKGKVLKSDGDDPKLDLVVGIFGAVLAGALVGLLGAGVSSFNAWSLAAAPLGAIGLLLAWRGFRAFATRG